MTFPEIPGYRIEKVLGRGGMAVVYLATQASFGRHVALKVLGEHLLSDPSYVQRFLREARLVAGLSHQNIVPVYDVGVQDGLHYIAMEYLPGGDLKQRLKDGLAISEGLRILREVAAGLDYAGRKHLVHRDIKPENILFREDDSAVISDFGIARRSDSKTNMTLEGSVVGTPHYMSPEQAEGGAVDYRSDLYSLGIILYEVLTGKVPFTDDSPLRIGIKHITEDPPPLPDSLSFAWPVVSRALAKSPDDRFQSGAEFIQALDALESRLGDQGKTVVMSPLTGGYSKGGRARRSRTSGANRIQSTGGRALPGKKPRGTWLHSGARWVWALGGVLLLLALILVGVSLYPGKEKTTMEWAGQSGSDTARSTILGDKVKRLLDQARRAIGEERLFQPPGDNAQYYLTTLMALAPESAEAARQMLGLFSVYLQRADAALNAGQIKEAERYLSNASQISFYVKDESFRQQLKTLYGRLSLARQNEVLESARKQRIASLLQNAERALQAGHLTAPRHSNAYDYYQQVLLEDPDNEEARSGVTRVAGAFIEQSRQQLNQGQYSRARAFLAAAMQIDPGHPGLDELRARLENTREQAILAESGEKGHEESEEARRQRKAMLAAQRAQIEQWLGEAKQFFEQGQLVSPETDNALARYQQVLRVDPINIDALEGVEMVGQALLTRAREQIRQHQFEDAEASIRQAGTILSSKILAVPLERELAAARKQFRMDQWLDEAQRAFEAGNYESPDGSGAADRYRLVLENDPLNDRARKGIEQVWLHYLELARSAAEKAQYDSANVWLEKAETLSENHPMVHITRRAIDDIRRQSEITALLARARTLASKGRLTRPEGDNAFAVYQQILERDPLNTEAKQGVSALRERLLAMASDAMKKEQFDRARVLIASARKIPGRQSPVIELSNALRRAEAAADKRQPGPGPEKAVPTGPETAANAPADAGPDPQAAEREQKIQSLLRMASELEDRERTDASNARLREIYTALLRLLPENEDIRRALAQTSAFEAALAKQDLKSGHLDRFRARLRAIQSATPGEPLVGQLQRYHDIKLKHADEVRTLLSFVEEAINKPFDPPGLFGNNDKNRRELREAFGALEKARQLDALNGQVEQLFQRLEQKYIAIAEHYLNQGEVAEARKFVEDMAGVAWPFDSDRRLKLEIRLARAEQSSNRRVPPLLGSF